MWFIKLSQTIPSDLIYQAYKLCSTGEDGFDLSYECLTSKRAKDALAKQVAASSEFAKSLQWPEIVGEEDDDELGSDLDDGDVHVVGTHMEKYTGHEFSPRRATDWWMEWDAESHM